MAGQTGVPNRRQAGLAIRPVFLDHQQLAHTLPGDRRVRMIRRIPECVEHHHAVRHRRVNRPQPIVAVQPFGDERHRFRHRTAPSRLRKQWFGRPQRDIHTLEEPPPGRPVRPSDPVLHLLGRRAEQLRDPDPARIPSLRAQPHQHQQRHDHGARPVRHFRQVERKPQRQVHDFQRHHRHRPPRYLPKQRQLGAGEHVRPLRPASRQDRLARAAHMRRIRIIPDRLQREIRLHARRDIERPVMEQRPAAMRALNPAKIDPDRGLQIRVDPVQKMLEQHVFGRNRRIRFQFEQEMPVRPLPPRQRRRCARNRVQQRSVIHNRRDEVH